MGCLNLYSSSRQTRQITARKTSFFIVSDSISLSGASSDQVLNSGVVSVRDSLVIRCERRTGSNVPRKHWSTRRILTHAAEKPQFSSLHGEAWPVLPR